MHNQENQLPQWQPYADEVVTRLREHHARQAKAQGKPNDASLADASDDASPAQLNQETGPAHALLDDLLMTDDYPHLPSDAAEALREAGVDPQATLISGDDRPAIRLPSHRLSLAIRLAATIGDETAMRHYTVPGGLTLITGFFATRAINKSGLGARSGIP